MSGGRLRFGKSNIILWPDVMFVDDGMVLGCGCNGEGQLGTGDTTDTCAPVAAAMSKVPALSLLACGADHSAALTG